MEPVIRAKDLELKLKQEFDTAMASGSLLACDNHMRYYGRQ